MSRKTVFPSIHRLPFRQRLFCHSLFNGRWVGGRAFGVQRLVFGAYIRRSTVHLVCRITTAVLGDKDAAQKHHGDEQYLRMIGMMFGHRSRGHACDSKSLLSNSDLDSLFPHPPFLDPTQEHIVYPNIGFTLLRAHFPRRLISWIP